MKLPTISVPTGAWNFRAGVSPDDLTLVPDCGFSQTPRAQARAKLRAMVAGRDLVFGRDLAAGGGHGLDRPSP